MNDTASSPQSGRILVVDDIMANRNLLREALEPMGHEVLLASNGETGIKAAKRAKPDVILLDLMMPGMNGFETCQVLKSDPDTEAIPVIFITAKDETQSVVDGFRAGGVDYILKPFQAEEVLVRVGTHLQNARLTREVIDKNRLLEDSNRRLREEIARREQSETSLAQADSQLSVISEIEAKRWGLQALIGRSGVMAKIVGKVRKLQALDKTSVLLLGESGTGKELFARAIHFGGSRSRRPFLPVNCSAIPADLAESLLFGHVKGAFSGATTDKKGYFENASGGTLFLDEIGDMPLPLQAKLLRVLETGKILPLGSERERPVDVRMIAATHAEMELEVSTGTFRQDLYYRLARYVISLPPLSERREDIPDLADHFVAQLAGEIGVGSAHLSPSARDSIGRYEFPGNVRELKNLIERALIESGGGEILEEHLDFRLPVNEGRSQGRVGRIESVKVGRGCRRGSDRGPCAFPGSINNAQCRELLGVDLHRAWYLLRKLRRSDAWFRAVQDGGRNIACPDRAVPRLFRSAGAVDPGTEEVFTAWNRSHQPEGGFAPGGYAPSRRRQGCPGLEGGAPRRPFFQGLNTGKNPFGVRLRREKWGLSELAPPVVWVLSSRLPHSARDVPGWREELRDALTEQGDNPWAFHDGTAFGGMFGSRGTRPSRARGGRCCVFGTRPLRGRRDVEGGGEWRNP